MSSNSTLASTQNAGFGSFVYLCRDTASYPFCNLFWRQLSKTNFTLPDPLRAPVGITPRCGIPRAGGGRFGNIANVTMCAVSIIFIVYLSQRINRRRAAVGRIEIRALFIMYAITLLLEALTSGGIFSQGSLPLLILTAIHAGAVAAFFWALLANALVATQFVEDGTPSALLPFYGFAVIIFLVTTYIATDTAFSFTSLFKSTPPRDLRNVALFILLNIWPAATVVLYTVIMSWIIVRILGEKLPLLYYLGALFLLVGGQFIFVFLGTPICQGSNKFIDSSFLATLLNTASMGVLFLAWKSITESDWEDQVFIV
ncbi:hypothetical protein FRC14_006657 [Serendipita sp. 396]|nr:hypothetical protein FRC14_006657 [Serendipita sp. 396]KAG8786122.1 hypothetical protein FRC15_012069 [Serendipita sp. 397]KAG8854385.1 hypothetical protein FRB91_003555 [Serendipita sp. 411]